MQLLCEVKRIKHVNVTDLCLCNLLIKVKSVYYKSQYHANELSGLEYLIHFNKQHLTKAIQKAYCPGVSTQIPIRNHSI